MNALFVFSKSIIKNNIIIYKRQLNKDGFQQGAGNYTIS